MIDEKGNYVLGEPTEEMKKSTKQKELDYIESEIKDIQLMLAGSPHSKHWQEWKMKLDNLQINRKYHLWAMYGVDRYPHSEGDNIYSAPRKLKEMIPDL